MAIEIKNIPDHLKKDFKPMKPKYGYLRIASKAMTIGTTPIETGHFFIKIGDEAYTVPYLEVVPVNVPQGGRIRQKWDKGKAGNEIFCQSKDGKTGIPQHQTWDKTQHRYKSNLVANELVICETCPLNSKNKGDCKYQFTWLLYVPALDQVVKWVSKPNHVGSYFDFKKQMDEALKDQGVWWNPTTTVLKISTRSEHGQMDYWTPDFEFVDFVSSDMKTKAEQAFASSGSSVDTEHEEPPADEDDIP